MSMENAGVVVESILAVIIAVAVIYLAVTAKPIPELLSQAFMVVLGIYFTKRVQANVKQTTQPIDERTIDTTAYTTGPDRYS